MDSFLLDKIVCSMEKLPLEVKGNHLLSPGGYKYPLIDNVPIMLLDDVEQTIGVAKESLNLGKKSNSSHDDNLYLSSLGISEEEKKGLMNLFQNNKSEIDPAVSFLIAATNGNMYKHLIGNLNSYPIPDMDIVPVCDGSNKSLLDIGCNWGRWTMAAARKGYKSVGIDPSLGAVMAARRVANQEGISNCYLVADSRYLPFRDKTFDVVFSYSVFQHMNYENLIQSLKEIGRVLKNGGVSYIQMANKKGFVSLLRQVKRRKRSPINFEVRYWDLEEMLYMFEQYIGKTNIYVDCFFGLGIQKSDLYLMPITKKFFIYFSEILKNTANYIPVLKRFADSVFLKSIKS